MIVFYREDSGLADIMGFLNGGTGKARAACTDSDPQTPRVASH